MKSKILSLFLCTMLLAITTCATQAVEKTMSTKKILVIYYSKTGNTERVATELATKLDADLQKITDKKPRKGFLNTLAAAKDSMKKALTDIEEPQKKASDYNLTIVGTPTWMGKMTPAIRTYLSKNSHQFKKLAFFTTSGNTGPEKLVPEMESISGTKAIAFTGFNSKILKDTEKYNEKISQFIKLIKEIK